MKCGNIEYKMPEKMGKEIIKMYKSSKKNPQQILVDYVNEQYNLLYLCTRVILY